MSLYERLSPEALAILEQERKTYPATAEVVEKALKTASSLLPIPLGLLQLLSLPCHFKVNSLPIIEVCDSLLLLIES